MKFINTINGSVRCQDAIAHEFLNSLRIRVIGKYAYDGMSTPVQAGCLDSCDFWYEFWYTSVYILPASATMPDQRLRDLSLTMNKSKE